MTHRRIIRCHNPDGGEAMAWIKLTQMREKARKAIYINTDQIVRVMESVGAAKEYATMIALTSGSQDVCETIDEVMNLIEPKEPPPGA
jgi:hypothetical protein